MAVSPLRPPADVANGVMAAVNGDVGCNFRGSAEITPDVFYAPGEGGAAVDATAAAAGAAKAIPSALSRA